MKIKHLLKEAANPKVGRKYQHIEDLVLSDGSVGAMHAIERLKHMGEEGGSIELKWDGCVHEDSILSTSVGEMTIKEFIHKQDTTITVLGKNLEYGINCFTEVSHKTESIGLKDWVEVFFENGSSIKLTEDHQLLTTNRGWIAAGDLLDSDDVVSTK